MIMISLFDGDNYNDEDNGDIVVQKEEHNIALVGNDEVRDN